MISHVEIKYGPRSAYTLTLDVNALCNLQMLELNYRDQGRAKKAVLQFIRGYLTLTEGRAKASVLFEGKRLNRSSVEGLTELRWL